MFPLRVFFMNVFCANILLCKSGFHFRWCQVFRFVQNITVCAERQHSVKTSPLGCLQLVFTHTFSYCYSAFLENSLMFHCLYIDKWHDLYIYIQLYCMCECKGCFFYITGFWWAFQSLVVCKYGWNDLSALDNWSEQWNEMLQCAYIRGCRCIDYRLQEIVVKFDLYLEYLSIDLECFMFESSLFPPLPASQTVWEFAAPLYSL